MGDRSALCAALALGLMVTIAGPGLRADEALPTAKPETVGMSSERLQRLSQRMQQYIDKGQVAGMVTLIARQGKAWRSGHGG